MGGKAPNPLHSRAGQGIPHAAALLCKEAPLRLLEAEEEEAAEQPAATRVGDHLEIHIARRVARDAHPLLARNQVALQRCVAHRDHAALVGSSLPDHAARVGDPQEW